MSAAHCWMPCISRPLVLRTFPATTNAVCLYLMMWVREKRKSEKGVDDVWESMPWRFRRDLCSKGKQKTKGKGVKDKVTSEHRCQYHWRNQVTLLPQPELIWVKASLLGGEGTPERVMNPSVSLRFSLMQVPVRIGGDPDWHLSEGWLFSTGIPDKAGDTNSWVGMLSAIWPESQGDSWKVWLCTEASCKVSLYRSSQWLAHCLSENYFPWKTSITEATVFFSLFLIFKKFLVASSACGISKARDRFWAIAVSYAIAVAAKDP